ncbi:MAG TPA: response regulator [Anaerolineae bacterium]|nr:response regulator [Anaerolineae bacterium]
MTKQDRAPINPEDAYVLVVEDNVPNFVLIARLLAYTGIKKCEWKTTGWGVVDFANTMPRVDLILMDLRLPHEDGYEALKQVRSSEHLKDTLVVVVTAQASVAEMNKAKESGFDGFMSKPLDADRFPEQIRKILRYEPVWDLGL